MLKLAEHGNERRQWTNMVNKLTNASIAYKASLLNRSLWHSRTCWRMDFHTKMTESIYNSLAAQWGWCQNAKSRI